MRKFIVITGASKGIGRASADAVAEDGWSVIGVTRGSAGDFPGEHDRSKCVETDSVDGLVRRDADIVDNSQNDHARR